MHKTTFAAIAAGALIVAGIVGWSTTGSNRPLQAKASTAIEAQIDNELPIDECAN